MWFKDLFRWSNISFLQSNSTKKTYFLPDERTHICWGMIWHTVVELVSLNVDGLANAFAVNDPLFTSDLLLIPRLRLMQRLWSRFSCRFRTPGKVNALEHPWALHGYGRRPSCARATWSSNWHWFKNPLGQYLHTKGLSSSGVWNLKGK